MSRGQRVMLAILTVFGVLLFADITGHLLVGFPACTVNEKFYPHPYFTYVLDPNSRCHSVPVNADGFQSRDFPKKNPPGTFDVLITGGTLASRLSAGEQSQLVRALEKFVDADGKPVRVYSSSIEGWKEPQSLFSFAYYQNVFDGVVTIQGAAEASAIRSGNKLYAPTDAFFFLYRVPRIDYPSGWHTGVTLNWLGTTFPFLQHSFIFRSLKSWLLQSSREDVLRTVAATSADRMFKAQKMDEQVRLYRSVLGNYHDLAGSLAQRSAIFFEPGFSLGESMFEGSWLSPGSDAALVGQICEGLKRQWKLSQGDGR